MTKAEIDAALKEKMKELGAMGGKARAAKLSKRKLSNIGKKGAAARYADRAPKPEER